MFTIHPPEKPLYVSEDYLEINRKHNLAPLHRLQKLKGMEFLGPHLVPLEVGILSPLSINMPALPEKNRKFC